MDQQPYLLGVNVVNQESPDIQADLSTYVVSDITFDQSLLFKPDISVFFTNSSGTWEDSVTEARLSVFSGDIETASFDPQIDGMIVPVQVTELGADLLEIRLAEIPSIPVLAGTTVWFGLILSSCQ